MVTNLYWFFKVFPGKEMEEGGELLLQAASESLLLFCPGSCCDPCKFSLVVCSPDCLALGGTLS